MALDPYRRIAKRKPTYRSGIDLPPTTSRVPYVIGAIGLIAMLGVVYQLSVTGLSGRTAQLFSWSVQAPP
jgi:hypothetical protein